MASWGYKEDQLHLRPRPDVLRRTLREFVSKHRDKLASEKFLRPQTSQVCLKFVLKKGIAMGTTHDVKSSKKSKNGAASNLFQVMTIAASIQEAVICCQCLMICKKIKQR
jgi:hypothetical protein